MGLFIVLSVLIIGAGVGWYLIKRNSPQHAQEIETDASKVAAAAKAEVDKLTKK